MGTEHNNMMVECFPAIKMEQLHRVLENRDLGSPDTVLIHVGTNDLKRMVNRNYVMGEVYSLVNKAVQNVTKWGTAADRCVMAAYRSIKRQTRLDSEDIVIHICRSKKLV